MEFHHVPVLARQCMDALAIRPDGVYVDGTTGGGGHSSLIAQRLGEAGRLVCIDRDDDALHAARARLTGFACRIDFVKSNFMDMDEVLRDLGIPAVQGFCSTWESRPISWTRRSAASRIRAMRRLICAWTAHRP